MEILIIVLVVVVIFGGSQLPKLGGSIGKSIVNFKKALREENEIDVTPKKAPDEIPPSSAREDHRRS